MINSLIENNFDRLTMEAFIMKELSRGLCFPVWLDPEYVSASESAKPLLQAEKGGDECANKSAVKPPPVSDKVRRPPAPEEGGRKGLQMKSVVEARESNEHRATIAKREERAKAAAKREAASEGATIPLMDFEDAVSDIVQKRDDLAKQNALLEEEVARLAMENENQKNLNAVGKAKSAAQRDENIRIKINAAKDRSQSMKKFHELKEELVKLKDQSQKDGKEMEKEISKLRNQAKGVQNALDSGMFWDAEPQESQSESPKEEEVVPSVKEEVQEEVREEVQEEVQEVPVEEPKSGDMLDVVFGWTVGV